MLIRPITNFKENNPNYEKMKNKSLYYFSKKTDQNDSFQLSTPTFNKIPFKAAYEHFIKTNSNASLEKNIQSIKNHFSSLKKLEPNNTDKINLVENFVLKCIDFATEHKIDLSFSWHKNKYIDEGESALLYHQYSFEDSANSYKHPKMNVIGSGRDLYKLIKYTKDVEEETKQLKEVNPDLYKIAELTGTDKLETTLMNQIFETIKTDCAPDNENIIRFKDIYSDRI